MLKKQDTSLAQVVWSLAIKITTERREGIG